LDFLAFVVISFYARTQRTERIRDYFVGLVCYDNVLYKCSINNNADNNNNNNNNNTYDVMRHV